VKGFFNKILRINLKTKTIKGKTIPDSIYETYLGEKGFVAYLLMEDNPNGVNPLSPENKLIFFSGPITDTRIYGSSDFFLTSSLGLNRIF
jgi:aldehyde:ferredoxin oxidoreductase